MGFQPMQHRQDADATSLPNAHMQLPGPCEFTAGRGGCIVTSMQFAPSVYEHAARVIARSPWEVSRDAALLARGHTEAYRLYEHRPVVVGIDIYNLEAEAYGARVEAPDDDAIPAIHQPLLGSLEEGLSLKPFDPARDGRIAMALSVGQRLKREFPEADVRIPVAGPFSIAFNLRGIGNLCEDAALRPEDTLRMLMRLAENQAPLCRAVGAKDFTCD